MKYIILLLISFKAIGTCPVVKVTNASYEPVNQADRDNLAAVVKNNRCQANYPDMPCVKFFIKQAPLSYHVICTKDKSVHKLGDK